MRQFTHKEFVKIVECNGFSFARQKGSHAIYKDTQGKHISVPKKLECVIANRLIKEYNLNIIK